MALTTLHPSQPCLRQKCLPPLPCQAFLLICVGVVAATRSIHTYRSSLYTQGAVAVALSTVQGSVAYRFLAMLPDVSAPSLFPPQSLPGKECAVMCRVGPA